MMKAIIFQQPGDPSVLSLEEVSIPKPTHCELLVRVKAVGVNRADLLQRKGLYPPPPGASSILGLEISGEVVSMGNAVKGFQLGDRVCGLVPGGGYGEYCVLDADMAMKMPSHLKEIEGAAIPEAFLTAYENLYEYGKLKEGETVLIHVGGSGVGLAAIQLALEKKATVFFTTRSHEKKERVETLFEKKVKGIVCETQDFKTSVLEETKGKGVDVILDMVGAPYFQNNIDVLKTKGRLLQIAVMGGYNTEINLGTFLKKRLTLRGSTLRNQSIEEKRELMKSFLKTQWPLFEKGILTPVIDKVFSLEEASKAHLYMENNLNVGKVILVV